MNMYILQYNQITCEIYGIYNSIECLLDGVNKLITESSKIGYTIKEDHIPNNWCHESLLNNPIYNSNNLSIKISIWKPSVGSTLGPATSGRAPNPSQTNEDIKTILISNTTDYNNLSIYLNNFEPTGPVDMDL